MSSPLSLVENCSPLLLGNFEAETMDPSSSLLIDFATFKEEFLLGDDEQQSKKPRFCRIETSSSDDQDEDSGSSFSNSNSSEDSEKNPRLTLAKNPKLSKSTPLFKFIGVTDLSKDKFPQLEETSYSDLYPKCHYELEIHEAQIKLAKEIPDFDHIETLIVISAKRVFTQLPEKYADIKKEIQKAAFENDSLELVHLRDQLLDLYDALIDDDSVSDSVYLHLKKLISFTSSFNVTNFSVRDAAFAAQFASYSVVPEYKEFFSKLSEVLQADFIEETLLTKLRSGLKNFNDRSVTILRWILMNIYRGQIITKGEHRTSMEFSLSLPKALENDKESCDAFSTINPKKNIKAIIDACSKACFYLRRIKDNETASKWQKYFDQTTLCYNRILDDCTPQRIIKSGPLYGKTIATMTKFGPQSSKICESLPELVSSIIDNCSVIDEIIGHSRSTYILQSNIECSLTDSFIKLRDMITPTQPAQQLSRDCAIMWNIIKLTSFVSNPNTKISSINTLSYYVRSLAQATPSSLSHYIACISFQFSNADPTLTDVQKAFIEAEASLSHLSAALKRSGKKLHDAQQKKFVVQWYNYCENLVECLRALSREKNPIKQIADIYNVLEQLKTKAKRLNISRETDCAGQAIKKLYKAVNDQRRKNVTV